VLYLIWRHIEIGFFLNRAQLKLRMHWAWKNLVWHTQLSWRVIILLRKKILRLAMVNIQLRLGYYFANLKFKLLFKLSIYLVGIKFYLLSFFDYIFVELPLRLFYMLSFDFFRGLSIILFLLFRIGYYYFCLDLIQLKIFKAISWEYWYCIYV